MIAGRMPFVGQCRALFQRRTVFRAPPITSSKQGNPLFAVYSHLLNNRDTDSRPPSLNALRNGTYSRWWLLPCNDQEPEKGGIVRLDFDEVCPIDESVSNLIRFGRLEQDEGRILEAESFYRRALQQEPFNAEAQRCHSKLQRTVDAMDNKSLELLYKKRAHFQVRPFSKKKLQSIADQHLTEHIHATLAMEGNQLLEMEIESMLDIIYAKLDQSKGEKDAWLNAQLAEKQAGVSKKRAKDLHEVVGMAAAFDVMTAESANVGQELTQEKILSIHKSVLCDNIDEAGRFRSIDLQMLHSGGYFVPIHHAEVPSKVDALLSWLNKERRLGVIDPVELAALAHFFLVMLHPFADGNGRTSRIIMNYLLIDAGFPPILIPYQSRDTYYGALRTADYGDLRPFLRLITKRVLKAFDAFDEIGLE